MYYGSSFAYLTAIASMVAAEGTAEPAGRLQLNPVLPPELISSAQFGIIFSGLISIIAGLLVRWGGREKVEKILPATVTGPVAMIIGLTLAANAIKDAAPQVLADGGTQPQIVWIISLVTLVSTVLYSRKLKGFMGQLPLLLGAATGCLTAVVIYLVDGGNFFRTIPQEALDASVWKMGDGGIFALPAFTLPRVSLGGGGGHHAHRYRHHPGIHRPYLPA